jgi:hypothetical protein
VLNIPKMNPTVVLGHLPGPNARQKPNAERRSMKPVIPTNPRSNPRNTPFEAENCGNHFPLLPSLKRGIARRYRATVPRTRVSTQLSFKLNSRVNATAVTSKTRAQQEAI